MPSIFISIQPPKKYKAVPRQVGSKIAARPTDLELPVSLWLGTGSNVASDTFDGARLVPVTLEWLENLGKLLRLRG